MDRREFLCTFAGSLTAAPLAAQAQESRKIARVGILGIGPAPSPQELARSISTNPFWRSMRELGWVDGHNMVVERRFGESGDQLRTGAADLVRLTVRSTYCSFRARTWQRSFNGKPKPFPSWLVAPTMILLLQDSSTAWQGQGATSQGHSS